MNADAKSSPETDCRTDQLQMVDIGYCAEAIV